jgi:hypothetical protein
MIKKVRFGVFETNSSSSHSLTMMDKKEFERWKNEGLYIWKDCEESEVLTQEQALGEYEKLSESERKCYDDFDEWADYKLKKYVDEDNDLEWFEYYFTTKSGDEIVVFGEYGYEG